MFINLNSYKKRQKAKSSGPSDVCRICGCSFAIRLGNFCKTSYISTENLFVRPKREGILRRKLADVLVDLGIAVQADEFRSSRVCSSCASTTRSAASNIEFIKKSLARPIDGVESPKRLKGKLIVTSDSKECHVRLTRLGRSKSYASKVIRQRILNNASKTPSNQPQARRFISFDCSTATTRTTTFPSSCICFVITSGTSR